MPARFARLRVAGFKSFAEPAVLELLPGLTGIVGPNGCGKSNVVEALRWAMGEASARSLRGAEMDDVIFAGAAQRPRRDIAEVTLFLEDTAGLAPPPFHAEPALEVSRRIVRGGGSVFRVNGREARARDVQTLFADLATGARASAMVSQGRVAAVVAASPTERRALLEEAAGITGLHARRHEAELRLRAAEANLARADDHQTQLAAQLEGLHRQAKQAARYRGLDQAVAEAEAELLAVQLAAAIAARDAAAGALAAARAAVAAATASATAAMARASEAASALPESRSAEAAARTFLERTRLEGEAAEAAAVDAERARVAAADRAAQVARDLAHARTIEGDAAAAADRLATEAAGLEEAEAEYPARLRAAQDAAQAAGVALAAAETAAQSAIERSAERVALHRAAAESAQAARAQATHRAARLAQATQELARAETSLLDPAALAASAESLASAEMLLRQSEGELASAEAARPAGQAALAAARSEAATAEAVRTRLAATAQGLADTLAAPGGTSRRVGDALTVPPGLEAALGAALGEELESGVDPSQPRHWRALPPLAPAPLPGGVTRLADRVMAVPELARVLDSVGLVEDGAALQALLAPGQILVSRAGAAWRWDGHTLAAGAPRPATVRLQQRNRLAALRADLATAEAAATAARRRQDEAERAERVRTEAEQRWRQARREAQQRAERHRSEHASLAARATSAAARGDAARAARDAAAAEANAADAALATADATLAAVGDPQAARATMERARTDLGACRAADTAARAALDGLVRAAGGRANRRRSIGVERQDWVMRAADARERLIDLEARAREAAAAVARHEAAPAEARARRDALRERRGRAEAAHAAAAGALTAAEAAQLAAERDARRAEAALSTSREDSLRAEAGFDRAGHAHATVQERVGDRPLPAIADATPEREERARRRVERLVRERAEMGPVNLLAEAEAAELEARAAAIRQEAAELTTAIAKLRGSIGHINREGRERVGQVFADIDRHFRALSERMFGGGRAHLALVGSDDPLLAGLEIFAQPPGKKLSSLSLLSGGEQALAALSLIFAVFRCHPAPICVLDEVDAPLDDANVGRFCALLHEMVQGGATRFLVVTHHQLTMARMDRLYGVTMQERGVSRLLSVDLGTAEALVERQAMAAE